MSSFLVRLPAFPFLLACVAAAWIFPAAPGSAAPDPAAEKPPAWVQWDPRSDRVISAAGDVGCAYPRARQLSNGETLLVYHHGETLGNLGSRVTVRRSRDGGDTWFHTREVDGPKEQGFWGFSNPDFVELGQGRLLLVSAARGKADPSSADPFRSEGRRSGLRLRFSKDWGATWGPPKMVASGRGRLWEPAIVRLPDGELQIFYANESPDLRLEGAAQCIEAIRSSNEGGTWTAPVLVSEHAYCRDGMPAVLAMSDGRVMCAQEIVGIATSPWISDTLQGRRQNYRLAQDRYGFGGAPFLARAPDGSTLLAFHSQIRQTPHLRRMGGAWLLSDIFVQRGDAAGRDFGPASCPWPTENALAGAFFPSLTVNRDGGLAVMASFITVHPDRTTSTVIRSLKGRLTGTAQ